MARQTLGIAGLGGAALALGLAFALLAGGCTGVVSIGLEASDGGGGANDDSGFDLASDSGTKGPGGPVLGPDAGHGDGGAASTEAGCSTAGTDAQTTSPGALTITGLSPASYNANLDTTTTLNGASTMMLTAGAAANANTWAATDGFFTVGSTYAGKRYRMRAEVKTENAQAAFLWFRIDTATEEVLANMQSPTYDPIVGTNDWQGVELVLDVPAGAQDFSFGSGLVGLGTVWVGPITLEAVQTCVAVSPNSGLTPSM